MNELAQLIAEQARDMKSDRVWPIGDRNHTVWVVSLDALASGADAPARMVATDPRHGTENLYQRRCRCARCRSAHAAYRQQRRQAGREPW